MFASFVLFIKNFHTVNDDHAVFNLNLSEKTCKMEKRDKVTWDDSLSLDATTITLYTKWPLCLRTSKY